MKKTKKLPTTLRGFLTALKAQRRRWYVDEGEIRFKKRKDEQDTLAGICPCPLTAVYGGYSSSVVPYDFRLGVMNAADDLSMSDPKIRRALLRATGLKEKVAV